MVLAGEASRQVQEQLPLNFGKRLAHTDKVVRDRGFRTLKRWLHGQDSLERLDYMKLWKGLYFGMWMADKPKVQQELAVSIALLLNDIPRAKQAMWIDTFWETMQTAWEQLDFHRLNKYMLFVRIVAAEAFKVLRVNGWALDEIRSLTTTFTRGVPLDTRGSRNMPSLGLLLQFVRVLWEELQPQLDVVPPSTEALLEIVVPFCTIAAECSVEPLVRSIHSHVFRRVPVSLAGVLAARLRAAADGEDVPVSNEQALVETAEFLEKLARNPSAAGAAGASGVQVPKQGAVFVKKRKARNKKRKKGKAEDAEGADGSGSDVGDAKEACPISPLLLPQAAEPSSEGKKRRKRRVAEALQVAGRSAAAAAPAAVKEAETVEPEAKKRRGKRR